MSRRRTDPDEQAQVDAIIEGIRELKRAKNTSKLDFLKHLRTVEREHGELLTRCGCHDFTVFLRSNRLTENKGDKEYVRFRAGASLLQREADIDCIGVDAVVVASDFREPRLLPEYLKTIREYRQSHGGEFPDRAACNRMRRNLEPDRPKGPSELQQLRIQRAELLIDNRRHLETIQQIEREVTEKDSLIANLRAKIEQLEAELQIKDQENGNLRVHIAKLETTVAEGKKERAKLRAQVRKLEIPPTRTSRREARKCLS